MWISKVEFRKLLYIRETIDKILPILFDADNNRSNLAEFASPSRVMKEESKL